jgi:hypothetical protein
MKNILGEAKLIKFGLDKRQKRIRPQTSGKTSDLFQTDPAALEPLLPFLRPFKRIWEPAAGMGFLARSLEFEGHEVVLTDIDRGFDFLEIEARECDAIVTNPPYSIKDAWIDRCYDIGKPFALLLPYMALEGNRRQALYRRYGVDLLFLPRRVVFITPSGKKGGAWFPTAWFTYKMLPERMIFS